MPSTKTKTIGIRVSHTLRAHLLELRDQLNQNRNPMVAHLTLSSVTRHLLELGLQVHLDEQEGGR